MSNRRDVNVPTDQKVLTNAAWARIIAARESGTSLGRSAQVAEPWRSLFAPLLARHGDRPWLIGQLGQSLDGRIATPTGQSHYINGKPALVHLHRLRALVDAVVVGVGTAVADDPQLTVRHVTGRDPARVVIDGSGRLPAKAKLLRADGCRRIIVTGGDTEIAVRRGVEILRIGRGADGQLDPRAIVQGLAALGLRRILVEGGMATLSAFLAADCLDRLHIAVAPLIIGSGPVGMTLPAIDRLDEALRPAMAVYRLGQDILLDCALRTSR